MVIVFTAIAIVALLAVIAVQGVLLTRALERNTELSVLLARLRAGGAELEPAVAPAPSAPREKHYITDEPYDDERWNSVVRGEDQ